MLYCRGKWIEKTDYDESVCQCAKMKECKRYTTKPTVIPLNPGAYFDRVPWSIELPDNQIRVNCDHFIPDYDAIRKIKDREKI